MKRVLAELSESRKRSDALEANVTTLERQLHAVDEQDRLQLVPYEEASGKLNAQLGRQGGC